MRMSRADQPRQAKTDKREHHYLERMSHHRQSYPEFHWPSVEALLNLIYTDDVIQTYISHHMDKYELSPTAFNVLMILSRCEDKGCPMHELSELLLVTRANITGLVDSLEKKGLVERNNVAGDRRVRLARMTKAGEELLEKILPQHYANVRAMLSGLTNAEKETLSKLLTKLRHRAQHWVETQSTAKTT